MRNLAVTVLGVFPACALCYFVLPASIFLIGDYLDTGDMDNLLNMLLTIFAVIGTFALFFSIDSPPGPVRIAGLVCGIIAMFGLDGFSYVGPSPWSLFFIGPVGVAVFLIIEGVNALNTKTDEPDHWSY